MQALGVYIHIPFCVRKCVYCDFLSAPATQETQRLYVEALKREIKENAGLYTEYTVETIFFGGGTPSLLKTEHIEDILSILKIYYKVSPNAEITLEANPKTTDLEKLCALRAAGINRLSIGLQSTDNNELKIIGRVHTYEDFLQTYSDARAAGFDNINIDLMSALPSQTLKSWTNTLKNVLSLAPTPEHISAYSLIVEEGTPLYEHIDRFPPVPDEETERQMYYETNRILGEYGYIRYEISNYARQGYESRHNRIYWQRGIKHTHDYAGFGLGASSTVSCCRWKNTSDMSAYLAQTADIREDVQTLSQTDLMEEFVFLGLRMTSGISAAEFYQTFQKSIDDIYRAPLEKWLSQGLFARKGDNIYLTDKGIDLSNTVLADFIL